MIFIGTANYIDGGHEPLRDRIEVISLPGYGARKTRDRQMISHQTAVGGKRTQARADRMAGRGNPPHRNDYTHEAGVSELERQIASVCRGIASQVARAKPSM